jgi:hypothetical protein
MELGTGKSKYRKLDASNDNDRLGYHQREEWGIFQKETHR